MDVKRTTALLPFIYRFWFCIFYLLSLSIHIIFEKNLPKMTRDTINRAFRKASDTED